MLVFPPKLCQHVQPALNMERECNGLTCSTRVVNSSMPKGSSAAGLMDTYSRDRESNAAFVIPVTLWGKNLLLTSNLNFPWHNLRPFCHDSSSSKRCWAWGASKAPFQLFFSFKPQEANDFHLPFCQDVGQRKQWSPLLTRKTESLTKIGSSETFNLSFVL